MKMDTSLTGLSSWTICRGEASACGRNTRRLLTESRVKVRCVTFKAMSALRLASCQSIYYKRQRLRLTESISSLLNARIIRMRDKKRKSRTRRTVVQQDVREPGRRHSAHIAAEHASFERVSPSSRDDEDIGGDSA